jgi:hypothetical protein
VSISPESWPTLALAPLSGFFATQALPWFCAMSAGWPLKRALVSWTQALMCWQTMICWPLGGLRPLASGTIDVRGKGAYTARTRGAFPLRSRL